MTKKKSSEILVDERQEIFREKVKLLTFFRKSENFSEIGGNLKQGGKMHHGLRGGWTPLHVGDPLTPLFGVWASLTDGH